MRQKSSHEIGLPTDPQPAFDQARWSNRLGDHKAINNSSPWTCEPSEDAQVPGFTDRGRALVTPLSVCVFRGDRSLVAALTALPLRVGAYIGCSWAPRLAGSMYYARLVQI